MSLLSVMYRAIKSGAIHHIIAAPGTRYYVDVIEMDGSQLQICWRRELKNNNRSRFLSAVIDGGEEINSAESANWLLSKMAKKGG